MLILTRRVGETLMIGDEVTVTVLGVKGNQVRIGVNAPRTLRCIAKKSMNGLNASRTASRSRLARRNPKPESGRSVFTPTDSGGMLNQL